MYVPALKSPLLNIISAVLHMRKSSLLSDTRGSWQFRKGDILLFRHTNSSSRIESFRKCGNLIDARTECSIVYEPKTVQLCDALTKGRDLKISSESLVFWKWPLSLFFLYLFFVLDLTILYHIITIEDIMKPSDYKCLKMCISTHIQ